MQLTTKIWCNISICKLSPVRKMPPSNKNISSHQCFPFSPVHCPRTIRPICQNGSLFWWSIHSPHCSRLSGLWLGIDCILLNLWWHCSGITQLSVVSDMLFRKFIKSVYQARMVLMMLQLNPPGLQQNITIFNHQIFHKRLKDGLQQILILKNLLAQKVNQGQFLIVPGMQQSIFVLQSN